ncbi:MAG: D-sedoheptulose 7-phosphate isomerase [bacterium]|nr:D-sedoheptulose 7-phosphate isomerase [bacterium]MDT8366217.1 D-sedoheptulose 7-phosphate isomerase [bacterium]
MKKYQEIIIQRGQELSSLTERFCKEQAGTIALIADTMVKAIRAGGKVLVIGNGGSAGDAQHFAAELVNRFLMERKALPGLALTTDTSVLTSIANDYSYEQIFSRQVEALGRDGDVLLAISTSGTSPNVLKALEQANLLSMATIGMTGSESGKISSLCDICMAVPDQSTPRIQEVHHLALHVICEIMEIQLFSHGT